MPPVRSPRPSKVGDVGLREGFRSGLEERVAKQLRALGVDPQFEQHRIEFEWPARTARYTPDFRLPNGIFVETKGRFVTEDRQKHLLIKAQRPDLEVRFVFTNSRARISKTSATTYADWCEKHGFIFADKAVPPEWIN